MPDPDTRPIRIERTFHPDGSIAEEIHYLGMTEHGPWRTWHPNGQLAAGYLFEIGAYINCTNRTWYPDGRLESEAKHDHNGRVVIWNRYTPAGRLLPTLADQQRTRLDKMFAKARQAQPRKPRKVSASKAAEDAAFIDRLLASRTDSAALWLQGPGERTLGEFDPNLSAHLVTEIEELGTVEILAVEIEDIMGSEDQTASSLILRLPPDPKRRAQLFSFVRAYTRSEGFDPEPDYGQEHLFLRLC